MARSLPVENLLPQNVESIINYLQEYTEAAQWETPSSSRPQSATDNGVRHGRSSCLVAPPTLMGSTHWATRIARCKRGLQIARLAAATRARTGVHGYARPIHCLCSHSGYEQGKAKKSLYERVIVPTALYGAEAWGMRGAEKWKVNVLEMKCLRSVVGMSQMARVRNEEVRMRDGIGRELANGAHQRVLRWFGHVERMDEYRMARWVLMAEVSGGRVRGRPRLGW